KYVVVSEDIWRFRVSAGYGSGPNRMKGRFGGAEFKVHDWLYLLGEHDTRETNVGARVVLPQFWKVPISFTATAKTSVDYKPGNFDVAVGMSLPLDFSAKNGRAARHTDSVPETAAAAGSPHEPPTSPSPSPTTSTPPAAVRSAVDGTASSADLASLRDLFVQAGFLNVRIGTTSPGTVVVEYENVRFNHNELDGMGVATGIVTRHAPDQFDSVRLVLKRHDIPIVHITMTLRAAVRFLNGDITKDTFNDTLMVSFETDTNDTDFLPGTGNSGFLKSSLLLYPGLTTFVGTEYGAFDYLLSLKPELLVNAWKGAVINARWDIPVSWSDNLDDGKVYRTTRHPSQIERLMLFQAFKPSAAIMANLGGGMILHGIYGTLNEAMWSPGNGAHRVRVTQAYGTDVHSHQTSVLYLGSYRYYFSPLDLSVEGTGGKFWAQDTGFSLELKRFFGDTAVSLYYKNTKGNDDKKWQAVGLQLSFPLTLGKDMKHFYSAQVRGADGFSYAQETTLKNSNSSDAKQRGSTNYLAPYPLAINPQPTTALYRAYYNRDRLSEAYIRRNLDRLRDAWGRYGNSP
ncbi:MAG: YjbH domain-containing protein, partial [Desulfuromonadaceae bacterium]